VIRLNSAFLLILTLAGNSTVKAQTNAESSLFVEWARTASAPIVTVVPGAEYPDLQPLGKMIGDATVVALSEAVHAGAEPLEFRNRVLQFLVEEKGFTAIAIESGIVEGRAVHDYVRGGTDSLSDVLANGISWTFDKMPQNEALVRWLHKYNSDNNHSRKINFYGFDVPGSPGNPMANRGPETALTEVLAYLDLVDPAAAAAFRARLDALLPSIRLTTQQPEVPGYQTLSQPERDTITAAITDIIHLLERREASYSANSSPSDYQWGYRAAIGAQQMDGWLRQIPLGWVPSDGFTSFFSVSTDIRDRAQADNLDWIIQQEGPAGKILVFASRYHLSKVPVFRGEAQSGATGQEVAGTYLHRRLGVRMVTIGNLVGQGKIGCAGFNMELGEAVPGSIDDLAGEVGPALYLLDLRQAPDDISRWLHQQHQLSAGGDLLRVDLGNSFDVLFYINSVSPACP